jgi:transcriptional regulator with XRE-family HTH domain
MFNHNMPSMDFVSKQLIRQNGSYHADMAGRPQTNEAPPFGAQLATLRKEHGWTQPQLAEKLGVTLATLVYYERQAKNPSADFVSKAAKLFNVSVDELLGHTVKAARKHGPPSRLQQLTEQLAGLPRNKQKVVVEMLEGFLQKTTNST